MLPTASKAWHCELKEFPERTWEVVWNAAGQRLSSYHVIGGMAIKQTIRYKDQKDAEKFIMAMAIAGSGWSEIALEDILCERIRNKVLHGADDEGDAKPPRPQAILKPAKVQPAKTHPAKRPGVKPPRPFPANQVMAVPVNETAVIRRQDAQEQHVSAPSPSHALADVLKEIALQTKNRIVIEYAKCEIVP